MKPEQLLEQLKPIHLPQEPSCWPLAPGWYALAVLLLLLLALVFVTVRYFIRKTAIRRAAQRLFKNIVADYSRHHDSALLARNIAELCKRVLLAQSPRTRVASLTQAELIAALENQKSKAELEPSLRELLLGKLYQNNAALDPEGLMSGTQAWIKNL